MTIAGNIIDLHQRQIYFGEVLVANGKIVEIRNIGTEEPEAKYISMGFMDAHVHIESSMLPPSEFARFALPHGTIGCVSDPHEIANVLGIEGVRYMIADAALSPLKVFFGVPSCVPATSFETAGATLGVAEVRELFEKEELIYLSEMMNYPGVLHDDPLVLEKIEIARSLGRKIDGHAPGLRGEELRKYINAGISTDHECFTLDEAVEKIELGMKVIIREGSAAKNFSALHPLFKRFPDKIMLCSDDKHPDDLLQGHINLLVRRALALGYDYFDVLQAASLNAVHHYNLPIGTLKVGDPADCIISADKQFSHIEATYVNGEIVAEKGKPTFDRVPVSIVNNAVSYQLEAADFAVKVPAHYIGTAPRFLVRYILALDGELITGEGKCVLYPDADNALSPNIQQDILTIAVVNRYRQAPPSLGFIKGFGLRQGAIASSVAHDSHNIVVVGADAASCAMAANAVLEAGGGIAAIDALGKVDLLPLPIAGLMSDQEGSVVASKYKELDSVAKSLGSTLAAPFMTLSFMALLVIPDLKLSDKGLFSGKSFTFADVFV